MQTCEIAITGLSHDGQGVGRLEDGRVVFVPDLLPGEIARIRITGRSRRHVAAECLERLREAPQRRRPPCILADNCGGCSLQHLSYPGQLQSKQDTVGQALGRIGHLTLQPQTVLPCASELGYRNRTVIPLERLEDGRLRAGFYRRGSHRIVNMNHCPVLDPRLDALIEPLKRDLEEADWPVDRHLQHGGGLRHLALRVGQHTGEVLITLIASNDQLDNLTDLAEAWRERWPQVVGVLLNIQAEPTNNLFGPSTRVLSGREWLKERFAGLSFQLGCDTFFQVNTLQAEQVLPLLLGAMPGEHCQVVDAYCGVGAFTLPLAAAGHQVVGLELHQPAVALARCNAQLNGLDDRARFEQGPVAAHLTGLLPFMDAVVVDPPRKGLESAVRQALVDQPVPRLLYLSCDPATLARDLAILTADRYRLEQIQPLDFFPNTSHVECLAVLSS